MKRLQGRVDHTLLDTVLPMKRMYPLFLPGIYSLVDWQEAQ